MSWACLLSAYGHVSVRPILRGPLGSFLSSSESILTVLVIVMAMCADVLSTRPYLGPF